jgi:hypothetical protein
MKMSEPFAFKELEEHYYLFNNLPNINITSSTKQNKKRTYVCVNIKISIKQKIKANITQLVECNLAKIKVKGSNPFICFFG